MPGEFVLEAAVAAGIPLSCLSPDRHTDFVRMVIQQHLPNVAPRVQQVEIQRLEARPCTQIAVKIDGQWASFEVAEDAEFPSEFFKAWLVLRAG